MSGVVKTVVFGWMFVGREVGGSLEAWKKKTKRKETLAAKVVSAFLVEPQFPEVTVTKTIVNGRKFTIEEEKILDLHEFHHYELSMALYACQDRSFVRSCTI